MPLTGSENVNKQAFDRASQLLATTLHVEYPTVSQVLQQFDHSVRIDNHDEYRLFPALDGTLPLGLMVVNYDRSGGVSNETMVGLFADWSAVYAVIKCGLEAHGIKRPLDGRVIVTHDDVQIGDLIVDLGFTVVMKDTDPDGKRTWLYDGSGARVLLVSGYEYEVCRSWEGRDEFLSNL